MGLAESSHCARAFSSFSAQASHWSSFSCFGAWALGTRASAAAAQGLISCGFWALQLTGSADVVHRLSCSEACGIFPDKGWNPCSLHWQVDSYPLYPQGSRCGGSSPSASFREMKSAFLDHAYLRSFSSKEQASFKLVEAV